jgi:hypothetical protein
MATNTPTHLTADQAAHELEIDKRWVEQVSARHTQSSMWLIASLFALNGAGLIACSTLAEDAPRDLTNPAVAFVVGILWSLLCGFAARKADKALIGTLRDRVRVLAEAGKAGGAGTTEDQERSFDTRKTEVDRQTYAVTVFGVLAVLSWLAGVVLIAQVPREAKDEQPVHRVILECAPGACPEATVESAR